MFSFPQRKFRILPPYQKGFHHSQRENSGFSLMEVTLALGMAAFALTALLSMLPAGMDSLRRSMNDTISSHIATSVASRVRSGESLPASGLYFFDAQGSVVSSRVEGGFVAEAVIAAAATPSAPRSFRVLVSLSHGTDASSLQPLMTREGTLLP